VRLANDKEHKMKRILIAAGVIGALALSPAAVASGGLSGKYRTKIASGHAKGTWTLDFKSTSLKVSVDGMVIAAHNPYSVKGDKITIGPGAHCSKPGKYTFNLTGKKLKFTVIKDVCAGRKAVLSHTFTKV
jgi:hypothetical protein